MQPSADELAGVVDVFGALTRAELRDALSELAFKRDATVEDPAGAIDDAVASYHLVEYRPADVDGSASGHDSAVAGDAPTGDEPPAGNEPPAGDRDETLLVVGPAAFPELPAGAEDLPHIMSVPERSVDRSALGEAVADRFREEVAAAVEADDRDAADRLLDVSYELEAWAGVDASDARAQLVERTEE